MKELLYLKDTQLKQLIEKLFTSYRDSFADAKKTLDKYSIGIAHHKVLHLISMYKGITISELLKKLKVTKQSLNRVLKDLIKLETIFFEKDMNDTRIKHIFLNDKGKEIFEEVFSTQKKRIYKALLNSTSDQVINFDNVLKKIIDELFYASYFSCR
jgi:DNA-binding MarR family transcriptional regulator